jgi:hypothetical protein
MVEPNRLGRQVSRDSARDSSLYLVGHADRGTELARRAITALKTIVLYERLLQWMQMVSLGEALNRNDRPILILYRQRETGVDPLTVDQHRASSAGTLIATLLGAGEPHVFAKEIE